MMIPKETSPARPSTRLAVAVLFSLTLVFFGPARIYFGNAEEFPYGFASLLPYLAVLVLAVSALCFLALKAIPWAASEKLLGMLLAVAGLMWLQGNFLVWNYGLLDGHDIEWGRKAYLGLIDTPLWLLLLLLAFRHSTAVKKIARPLAMILIAAQALDLLFVVLPNSGRTGMKQYGIDESREFSFSSRRNVIVMVLDTFQTDVFQELLKEDRNYEKVFSGFTYFRNSLSGAPSTRAAVPEMLTSRHYDNSVPLGEFLESAYVGHSLPWLLKQNGYRCDIFPAGNVGLGIFLDRSLASNLKDRFPPSLKDVAFLVDLSLFRQAPHFLKIPIYNRQSWLLSRLFTEAVPDRQSTRRARKKMRSVLLPDQVFTDTMTLEARVDSQEPVFKFYHLRGVHPPLRMNEDCRLERMDFNRANYKRQARGLMKLVARFLAKLKHIQAFRDSLIFIVGDHGPGNWGLQEIHLDALGAAWKETPQEPGLLKVKAGALPLMLVKPADDPGEKPLAVSDAPVCLGDIPATAAAAVGLEASFAGRPLFSVQAADDRLRRHLHYKGFGGNKKGFMEPMSEYWVRGFSWLDESWHTSPGLFLPGGKDHAPPAAGRKAP
jgi:hypothetical protein